MLQWPLAPASTVGPPIQAGAGGDEEDEPPTLLEGLLSGEEPEHQALAVDLLHALLENPLVRPPLLPSCLKRAEEKTLTNALCYRALQ